MENKKVVTVCDLIAHCKYMNIVFAMLAGEMSCLIYNLNASNSFNLNAEVITEDFNRIVPQKIVLNDDID